LEAVENKKVSCPYRKRNTGRPARYQLN
jgi:hypothetical protein